MTTKDFQQSSALRIFLSYFKPHRRLFFMDLSCALMISIIDLTFPYVSRWCMYELLPESAYNAFFAVMAVVFAAFVLRAVLTYVICYWGHTFGILVEADIRRDLFRHMQELSFDYFDRNRTGQLMSRLTADLFDITELAHHGPEDLFISGVTIVGALVIMFTIQWRLARHPAHFHAGGVAQPPLHAGGLRPGEAEDRRHQRRYRVRPLRHPHRQGLRQRKSGAAEV